MVERFQHSNPNSLITDINDAIPYLIGVAGILWLTLAGLLVPSVVRVWRQRADTVDLWRTICALNGLLQFGFFIRWHLFPNKIEEIFGPEAVFWIGLYVTSTLIALLALYVGSAGWKR